MINNVIDEKAIDFFQDIIGKRLVSIEIGDSEKKFNRSYGKLRLNFSVGSIDIYNLEKPTEFAGEIDDISGFTCDINIKKSFVPYLDEATSIILIDQKVTEVSIIKDVIQIANNKEQIVFDEAIIMKTSNSIYMISRDWQYSELINFYTHSDYNSVNPIETVKENWSNFGEYTVTIKRIIKQL